MKIFPRLLGYLKPYWKTVVSALACTALMNCLTLLQPFLIKIMTDRVLIGRDFRILNLICLGFLILVSVRCFFSYAQGYLMNLAAQGSAKKMRQDVFEHLQSLPISFFERCRPGEIYSRSYNDVNLTMTPYNNLMQLINDGVIIVGAIGWMFYKDWSMTILNLLISPLVGIAITRFGRRIGEITSRLQAKVADLSSIIYENISGIKVVKSFTMEEHEVLRFANKNEENFGTQMKMVQASVTQGPVIEFLAALGIVVVVWYGALQIVIGKFTIGEMMTYWSFMVLAAQPLNKIGLIYSSFQSSIASAARVFEILDTPSEVRESESAIDPGPLQGKIEFSHIGFSYERGNVVLKDVNLTIEPGEVVALVGPNGAGKTTLVSLIPRFYDPVTGGVKIDGRDIREIKLRALRSQIGIVQQETILFAGTIRENIAYGKPNATEKEIVEAAKTAGAHEFIMRLPNRYDTEVGQRGLRVSGGQRQRIAIARALLRNPRILILDEYTSGLDSESENVITEGVESAIRGRTCLIIAHRLSTVRNADRIAVLDRGEIKEIGTHMELLIRGGLYTRLYESQLLNLEAV